MKPPRQRHHEGVFPVNVAAVALEEATQHVSQHFRIADFRATRQELQSLGDLAAEIAVRLVLGQQGVENFAGPVVRRGA